MKYYSLQNAANTASFREAVVNGIAPDKGLYFPNKIESINDSFFKNLSIFSKEEVAFQLIEQFIGEEIEKNSLEKIVEETVYFDFPLVKLNENISTLELFHGPTLAFKDVGARFMARCLGYFSETAQTSQEVTVLVATSGDTGGAVASGFLGVEGVKVVILYPSKKVSDIQEKQLTTLGQNITALEVDGTFDDCQAMVKNAFVDGEITSKMKLTSANSINVARWLPQMFYYSFALQQWEHYDNPPVFSVPSGNFGNICAGMVANKLGLPVSHFIASVNVNDVVPRFFKTENYTPEPSKATISNAMDVGDPSNFIRIQKLFNNNFTSLSSKLTSYSFNDFETKEAMQLLHSKYNYIADPHGAVGYLGLSEYLKDHSAQKGIFLETAHPIKFLPVVEETLQKKIEIPEEIQLLIKKEKKATFIKNYEDLKSCLLNK